MQRMNSAGARPGRLEAALGILNGVIGDYLVARSNPLAIEFGLYEENRSLACDREALARAHPATTGRLCVLVHGLAMNEGVWSFPADPAGTYGAVLRRDLGYTPLYVRYNTGLHVSENGGLLAGLLEDLVRCFPVEVREIVLVGHSMGGLVVRSACEFARAAGQPWRARVTHAFYLGSPHRGAAFEQAGNVVAWVLGALGLAHTSLVADVGNLRSAGIKDLRFASLLASDWVGRDPDALLENTCRPIPLAPGISHHFGVGGLGAHERSAVTRLLGDAVVSHSSAAARGAVVAEGARSDMRYFPGVGHQALAHHPDVARWIVTCCADEPQDTAR